MPDVVSSAFVHFYFFDQRLLPEGWAKSTTQCSRPRWYDAHDAHDAHIGESGETRISAPLSAQFSEGKEVSMCDSFQAT